MKSLLLVLMFTTLAYCQTTDVTFCVTLRVQNQTTCLFQLSQATTTQSDQTMFCASQCATDLRAIYEFCGATGNANLVEAVCNSQLPTGPDVNCILSALPNQTDCYNLLSSDPTTFCSSPCRTTFSTAYTGCGFTAESNPITAVCGIDLSLNNPICLIGRLSSLSNCVTELLTTPTVFCNTQCANTVSTAFEQCGYTGSSNLVNSVCTGAPYQDPVCISGRLQNLQSCVNNFLMNVTSFCDSACSTALTTAYNDCGYSESSNSNPISQACTPPGSGTNDTNCIAGRLQSLRTCLTDLAANPTQFCSSQCNTELSDAYVDCGFPLSSSPAYGLCNAIPSGGPDSLCLGERLIGLQSCVTTFLTTPTTFCSSQCFTDLRDAYTQCGFTGFSNPFEQQCVNPTQDPLCLTRRLLNVPQCVNNIVANVTAFCNSNCAMEVSNAYIDCGFNESNPVAVCLQLGQGGEDPVCLSSRLQTVEGCLTGFVSNPTSFCTSQCANDTRTAYNDCGYVASNPVNFECSQVSNGQDPICLVGNLQGLSHCLGVLLSNSTGFCDSQCYDDVNNAYNQCGYTGFSNPVNTTCSGAFGTPDPVCLYTSLQSQTACYVQLLTQAQTGTFCTSQCYTTLSSAFDNCGYTGFANPVQQGCLNSPPPGPQSCLTARLGDFQSCIADISTNPNNFCQSQCVTNINAAYSECGLPSTDNPVTAFCSGVVPTIPGNPDPFCLYNGVQNLQSCLSDITSNPTDFCNTQCATDLATAYLECGYNGTVNPVDLICNTAPGSTDLVCLEALLPSLQTCINQLVAAPETFCSTSCATELGGAYAGCGFTGTQNPVVLACTAIPDQEPFCITGKLTAPSVSECLNKIGDTGFCGSECDAALRTAFSECGFVGNTNPIAVSCSSVNGSQDTVCLGSKLQNLQECVTSLFADPASICDTNSKCATDIQNGYTECGFAGNNNPVALNCGQTGGAPAIVAVPVMVLSFVLLTLASLF